MSGSVTRRNALSLLVLLLLLRPGGAFAETAIERAVGVEVARALKDTATVGVHAVELDSGETVYAYSPDELRVIASNMKLFTTAAALDSFGAGYFYETRLLMRGNLRGGGVLQGDLGVVGSGDPQISGRNYDGDAYGPFRPWARELREKGVRRVTGDLWLAHGLFKGPLVHPDWPRDQLTSWYEAPVAALSFMDNCILVRVSPGRAGKPAVVETVPPVPLFQVESTATTRAKGRGSLAINRVGTILYVRGSINQSSGPFETWVTVPDPVLYFGSALRAALAEEGVEIEGNIRPIERLPGEVWERVGVLRSDLLTAVRTTNKRSQNFYAESLAKKLGARRCNEGSWDGAVRAVSEFLVSIGLPRGSFKMVDGSGMSRGNRFTPRHLTTLLRHMFFHPLGKEFAQSLPYGGEDMGSWKRRFAAPPYRGNVFAKTGTLAGVSTLSGYAKAVSGKSYAFSILINGSRGDARSAQDRIVMALIDHG